MKKALRGTFIQYIHIRKNVVLAGVAMAAIAILAALTMSTVPPGKTINPAEKLSHSEFETRQDELSRRLRQNGLRQTFQFIRQQLPTDQKFARDCHPLMHHLGHEAFKRLGNFQAAMAQSDEICNSGYVHGVIEANFMAASSIEQAITSSCPLTTREGFTEWQCFHGVGHGIMFTTNKDISKTIRLCETLSTAFAVSSCVNGAFMERFIIMSHSGAAQAPSEETNISLCRKQQVKYKSDCYIYAPTAYLEHHTNKYTEAFSWCKKAESEFVATCVGGVGSQAMKENITRPAFAAELCEKVPYEYRTNCVSGAITIYINHNASALAARPLCIGEFKAYQQLCEEVIDQREKMFTL